MNLSETTTTNDDITIFQHASCPEWGKAILAWERGKKRGYQFEDGKLRVFKAGWYDQLEELDLPLPKAVTTARRLHHKLGLTPRRVQLSSRDGISFEDQFLLFDHFYPDGFSGDAWRAEKRGADAKRRLKRHRDAAVADARETLSVEHLDEWIANERFADAWDAILGVLGRTDLVNKRQLASLEGITDETRRGLVLCTRQLLWGEDSYEIRFERFIAALALAVGKTPSWQLATALSALVHPDDHVFVQPTTARTQASWMAPRLRWSRTASAPLYMRLQRMIHAVRDELTEAGVKPADLLDVYDFMWTTLRPKAREQLAEVRANATSVHEAA